MAFINLKCSNCGGDIVMDDSKEKGFCMFCGSSFLVKDEIYRIHIEHSGTLEISRKSEVENLVIRAREKAQALIANTAISLVDFRVERREILDKYIENILDLDARNLAAQEIRNQLEENDKWRVDDEKRKEIEKLVETAISYYEKAKDCAEKYLNTEIYDVVMTRRDCINRVNPNLEAYKAEFSKNYESFIKSMNHIPVNYYDSNLARQQILILNDYKSRFDKHISNSWSSGCYIATYVYGSYDCQEVWTLRRFRDNNLNRTWFGKKFIRIYYAISPIIVKWFGKYTWFNRFWKVFLDKLVLNLQKKGIENSQYCDVFQQEKPIA